MVTRFTGPGAAAGIPLILHTSPEFAMKRLLAAGSGAIYQICRAFRDGESGRLHNPEFSLLEWYRPGYDHHQLMDELVELVRSVVPRPLPLKRYSYSELFQSCLGIDPRIDSLERLREYAVESRIPGASQLDLREKDEWLDLLLSHVIEPRMNEGICLVYDYPPSQASLARIRQQEVPVAERFELYLDGIELANGFHELTDADEQRARFQRELEKRQASGQTPVPIDERFLAALEAGMPACSGVALGIDRLLMRVAGSAHIDQVLAFPFARN
jgi:lysyl-tRNA synthetase class 2